MSLEIIFLVKKQRELEKKLHKKEANYNFWKDKEQNGSLTNSEKKVLKKIDRSLKNFKKYLKKITKISIQCYTWLRLFINELNYYRPTEVKSAFDGSYVLYESKGDKDARLSIDENFDIIRPYLKDAIDIHKARKNGKYN